MDINGYFVPVDYPLSLPAMPLMLVPVTPCRVADTRQGQNTFGQLGPPSMAAGSKRDLPIPLGPCNIPSTAKAYSVNVTAVPSAPLGYLTAWPAGVPQPLVSTLNSLKGKIVPNAAIVPAGENGTISIYVSGATDVVVDINGYFTPEQ
jgi:hypothetical protein